MSLHSHFTRLNSFLDTLARQSPKDRRDAVANEVIECGGTYTAPPSDPTNCPRFLFEISLHGVTALGTTEDDAIRNWIDLARTYQVPFPAPRNHAEEIANAQAVAGRA